MTTDTVILATAWIHQPALSTRPERTLLVGAATLGVRYRFGTLGFDIEAHSTTVTDDPAETMTWLAERLHVLPERLLLWRAEDIVVPSLISACETARNTIAAARLLRELKLTFEGHVVDVAKGYGGASATSFDAVAHSAGVPFVSMSSADRSEAHRTGCHGAIRNHTLRAREGDVTAVARWPRGCRFADRRDRSLAGDSGRLSAVMMARPVRRTVSRALRERR